METISRSLLTFLLNSLWQIPLATAVAALACRFMRNGPAGHRHAVWVAALIAAVLLPLASIRPRQSAPLPVAVSYAPTPAASAENSTCHESCRRSESCPAASRLSSLATVRPGRRWSDWQPRGRETSESCHHCHRRSSMPFSPRATCQLSSPGPDTQVVYFLQRWRTSLPRGRRYWRSPIRALSLRPSSSAKTSA